MMFTRSVAVLLSALSVATAWPIFFYESTDCNHYPVLTIESPFKPNTCYNFGRVDIQSYSGGTKHGFEKILLYNELPTCFHDAAHRAYANYTIDNSTTTCHSFGGWSNVPRAYVLIEEVLGPIPRSEFEEESACNNASPLMVQN